MRKGGMGPPFKMQHSQEAKIELTLGTHMEECLGRRKRSKKNELQLRQSEHPFRYLGLITYE